MDSSAPLQVAVVGVGRMGKHHARVYSRLAGVKLVAVVDRDEDRAGAVADEFHCECYPEIEALLARHPGVRAVSVAVPTVAHVAAAAPLLRRGIACLVEKPLAPTVEAAQQLTDLAAAHNTALQVGHTERFNPAIRAVAAMGLRPRFIEVDRVSPMTFRSLDVGVVMDMMIHDLDIILMLSPSRIRSVQAVGVAVLGEHEDVANARVEFEDGCVANLTASRLALKTERKMRLFSEQAYVTLDYARRTGIAIRRQDNAAALTDIRAKLAAGADMSNLDYSQLLTMTDLNMDLPEGELDPLSAELTSFLTAVRQGVKPAVDGEAGSAAVEAAQRVVQSIRAHHWEGLTGSAV